MLLRLWDCSIPLLFFVFFFKQKTAYEMRISDWSSDVCSSDLLCAVCVQICDALNRCYRTTIKLHIGAERFHCLGEWSRHQHKAGEILHPLPRRLDIGRKHFVMIRVGGNNATMRLGEREIGRASCRDRVGQYV